MENIELVSFKIISSVGGAKSNYIEAIRLAEKGEFEKAQEKIKEGEQSYVLGHEVHANLIQQEASGKTVTPNLLLMHAEDQLLSCETIKIMAQEIIKLSQRLYVLENK